MEKEKNGKWIIVLLILVIIILATLLILFVTGTISFNYNEKENKQKSGEVVKDNDVSKPDLDNTKALEEAKNIYSVIIDEYKKDIAASSIDNISNYNYVNENAINHYFNQKGTDYEFDFKYSFYDINNDGSYELLINDNIIDIFSYDGENIIRLFKDDADCLAETRCSLSLYDSGIIYFSGSGGASSHFISFNSINKNSSTLNTINSYYLSYKDDGSVEIYDGKTYDFNNDSGTKLNFNSVEELEKENINNTSKIDLSKLNWNKLN